MRENLDPNIIPEKQPANPIKYSTEKSQIDHGRAGLRRRRPFPIINPSFHHQNCKRKFMQRQK